MSIEWDMNLDECKNLALRSKILNILNEIILKIGLHIEKFDFYITLISSSLTIDDLSEVYLTEVKIL